MKPEPDYFEPFYTMNSNNVINLLGYVGQDPTVKTLPSGNPLIEFSLATNSSYKNSDGERITRTDWHRIKAFGKVAEVLENYVTKGMQLSVMGTMRYNEWTDDSDRKRRNAEVILSAFSFVGRNKEAEDAPQPAARPKSKPKPKSRKYTSEAMEAVKDVDVPF